MSIATEIQRLQTAKADLKTAIEGKGVTVPSSTKLDGYATLVGQISGGGSSGFRCTNKLIFRPWLLTVATNTPTSRTVYTYTFDGTVADCAIAIIADSTETQFCSENLKGALGNSNCKVTNVTALKFQDAFSDYLQAWEGPATIASTISLKFNGESAATLCSVAVVNNTVEVCMDTSEFSYTDPWGSVSAVFIFKGNDGSYDFDVVNIEVAKDD